jgi:hypothetical protein
MKKPAAAAIAIGLLGLTGAQAQRPARVTSGLAFAVTLTDGGRSISSDRVSLKIPDTSPKGNLVVRLEGWNVTGGVFSAPLMLENGTGAELFALRVDYVSSTESSAKAAGAAGRTSAAAAGVAAPLTWPRLAKGETSTPLEFRASPIVFSPETTLVVVMGTVSGVAIIGGFTVEGAADANRIDVDPSGDVFLSDATGRTLRAGSDGANPREVRNIAALRRPKPAGGPCASLRAAAAANSAELLCGESPDQTFWTVRGEEVSILDTAGATLRSFRLEGTGSAPIVDLAFGKTGRVYLLRRGGATIVARSF